MQDLPLLASIARDMTVAHENFEVFLGLDQELDGLLDRCAGNPYASAAVAPLRSHCRRFWYYYRHHVQLTDAITAQAKMARLIARRDYVGAQKAVDAAIAVLERLVASVDRLG
jgi:DNA-binding GntR family transcriptional regulator